MENYRIPPTPAWYTRAVCTPNNGLLYIAGNRSTIAYIPPITSDSSEVPDNQLFHLDHHVNSIVCDPNWSTTKWFVTMNDHNMIGVWDLATKSMCRGHKAHYRPQNGGDSGHRASATNQNNTNSGAMCITKDRQVLSIDRNAFVRYCIVSNTYAVLNEHLIAKPQTVCALKSSPYDNDILAVGYLNGLILLVNLKQSVVLQRLRGHDSEIISLEWMRITSDDAQPIEIPVPEPAIQEVPLRPIKRAECKKVATPRRDAPKAIVDEGDMFDIHSYDYLEEEFGTISRLKPPTEGDDFRSVSTGTGVVNHERFDYAEACLSLREQIVSEKQAAETESTEPGEDGCAVSMSDIRDAKRDDSALKSESFASEEANVDDDDTAKASILSTIGSSHNANELADIESDLSELKITVTVSSKVYLASGAQESFVIIWDVNDGSVSDKLQLKVSSGKMAIPKPIRVAAWYKPSELIVNTPNGNISKWSILSDVECKIHKSIELKEEFIDRPIIDICSNANQDDDDDRYVWTFSMHMQMICRKIVGDSSQIIANMHTLPIGMVAIRECPHDPHRLAIAGSNKRISILDLGTFKPPHLIHMQALTSMIQTKVLSLAWHPQNESQIAFSTFEGRVGVFDISKPTSQPEIMRNFCGRNVYSISYGYVDDKLVLFACNDEKLMMFATQAAKNVTHHPFKKFPHNVSVVEANEKHVAVGLSDGTLKVFDRQWNEVYSKQLSRNYFCSCTWSPVDPTKLAVAAKDDKIRLIDIGSDDIVELIGQSDVMSVVWSNHSATKLVSAGYDGTVRVWDAAEKECIAWYRYDNRMFVATFLPTDENYVICSGKTETVHMFDVRQHLVENIGPLVPKKLSSKPKRGEISWATLHQTDVLKKKEQEKKKLRKLEKVRLSSSPEAAAATTSTDGDVDNVTAALGSVKLETSYKMNFTTFFHLTNKEMNKDPLNCLEQVLTRAADDQNGSNETVNDILHSKLFSTRQDVQKLLDIELNNHKSSKTESIGNLIIPQLNYNLKEIIVDSITAKKLTQQQVALAPSISYDFWRNCCIAYASQCFGEGSILQGMPYLLAVHQTTELIDQLCEGHFYREAWIVAKLYKEAEEKKVFDVIATKWIKHLEQMGSLDSAALIAFMVGQPTTSLDLLHKRKNHTPQIENLVKLLQAQVVTQ